MSRSFSARTRAQSVFDAAEEDRLFMFRRLAKRDYPNQSRRLGFHDGNDHCVEQTKSHEPLLAVVNAVILEGIGQTFEDAGSIDEVQSTVLKVGLALGLTPREAHIRIVYTPPRFRKSRQTLEVRHPQRHGPPRGR